MDVRCLQRYEGWELKYWELIDGEGTQLKMTPLLKNLHLLYRGSSEIVIPAEMMSSVAFKKQWLLMKSTDVT